VDIDIKTENDIGGVRRREVKAGKEHTTRESILFDSVRIWPHSERSSSASSFTNPGRFRFRDAMGVRVMREASLSPHETGSLKQSIQTEPRSSGKKLLAHWVPLTPRKNIRGSEFTKRTISKIRLG
jgi:hypothetical protein